MLPVRLAVLANRRRRSTAPGSRCNPARGDRILRVPLFERPVAEQMIVAYLNQSRHHLSPEQLAALADNDEIGSPLYLQVALNELLTFGEYERVTEYLRGLPGTIPAMYEFVLEHLEREHGQAFVARVMSCLACGRYGMTEQELLALAAHPQPLPTGEGSRSDDAVAPLKWARLYRILAPHLLKRGDVLGFYHRQLREAVERRYLPDEETKRQTHADIAGYFEEQPLTNKRKLEEQPYQQTLGQSWEALLATLTDYRFLDAKLRGVDEQDLIEDYERAGVADMGVEPEQASSVRLIGGGAAAVSTYPVAGAASLTTLGTPGRASGTTDPASPGGGQGEHHAPVATPAHRELHLTRRPTATYLQYLHARKPGRGYDSRRAAGGLGVAQLVVERVESVDWRAVAGAHRAQRPGGSVCSDYGWRAGRVGVA